MVVLYTIQGQRNSVFGILLIKNETLQRETETKYSI